MGLKVHPDQVSRLNKAIYGLKKNLNAWFERLTKTLVQFGFESSKCDPPLFTHTQSGHFTYVLVYVVTGSSTQHITEFIDKLNAAFALRLQGDLDYFLGIEVTVT